jgi:hypothetical protein
MIVDKMTGQMSVELWTVGERTVAKMTEDKIATYKMILDEMSCCHWSN